MADTWINPQEIHSGSSNRVYTVSQNARTGLWGCSCPGWRTHRKCKHLTAMGLPTEDPITATSTPVRVRRSTPVRLASDFVDTPKHYDVATEGLGNPDEWRDLAATLAKGRGALKQPATATRIDGRRPVGAVGRSAADSKLVADLALVGLTGLPNTAEELLAATQARADVLTDPIKGDPEEFWGMFRAYERLIQRY